MTNGKAQMTETESGDTWRLVEIQQRYSGDTVEIQWRYIEINRDTLERLEIGDWELGTGDRGSGAGMGLF
jgi:hypothetical protein